ncbi:DNA cytosine methyltransferase [Nitratireductor sp. CH_MIT9313-5]|uniref:DNA cytosine methyltransferase n=1 Tax=Nitratireductor sp. CH_MIT9313-5 TaxID=3107764 RepID=UPI0030099DE3
MEELKSRQADDTNEHILLDDVPSIDGMDNAPEDNGHAADADQAAADDGDDAREMEMLFGKELSKVKDSITRWRVQQAKAAFRIGDLWEELSQDMKVGELTAFLANECQVPRRDVQRYVRLAKLFPRDCAERIAFRGEALTPRELLIQNGVASSVLLDLAGQDETVRDEAIRMIKSGRALQARELRGLKRDIALAKAAVEGTLDDRRRRAFRNAAARKARDKALAAADAWLDSLHALTEEVCTITQLEEEDPRVPQIDSVEAVAPRAAELLKDLPEIVDLDFITASREGFNRGWSGTYSALQAIAEEKVYHKEHYGDGEPWQATYTFNSSLQWQLAWAFGYDDDSGTSSAVERMREAGDTPLDVPVGVYGYKAPTVLEICAGAGGQAIGLEAAGFKHVGLVEIDKDAAATLRHNGKHWPVIEADLRDVDLSQFEGVDLLAGGVPCQPFSQAGKRKGAADERDLFPKAMKLIRELKPKAVMLENVTGALQASNAMHRLRILARMAALGYDAEWRILSGPDFGLPQKRRRAILVGFRRGIMHRFSWPEPLAKNAPTVGEALYDLMAANGWAHVDEWKERAKGYAPTIIGGSQKKGGIDLAQPKSRESWRELGVDPGHYAKAAPERDAPRDHMPKLTLEMMARLQGFRDDWQLQGSNLQKFRQIANAFPPAMAQAIGLSILRALTGYKFDLKKEQERLRRKSLNLKAVPNYVEAYPADWDSEELAVG